MDITFPHHLDVHIELEGAPLSLRSQGDDDDAAAVAAGDNAHNDDAVPPLPAPRPAATWMGRLGDEVPLSDLTVPGTHDSCARSIVPYVRTQNLTVAEQLDRGVRALDLRLRRNRRDGQLYCYHGGVPLGPGLGPLPLASVMADVWAFLEQTGWTETVLISVDNDDPADGRDPDGKRAFYRAVADFMASTPPWPGLGSHEDSSSGDVGGHGGGSGPLMMPRWFVEPHTPRLGDVRGRAVLLRRFRADKELERQSPLGLDLSAWVNDSADFTIVTPDGRFRIQDKWDFSGHIPLQDLVASKIKYIEAMMDRAAASPLSNPTSPSAFPPSSPSALSALPALSGRPPATNGGTGGRWFINFCSAVGEPFPGRGEVGEPRAVAVGSYTDWGRAWVDGINVLAVEYLRKQEQCWAAMKSRSRLGIVFMDYPELPADNDLIERLIEMNVWSQGD